MIPELSSIGLRFPRWQDALEAAYGTGLLGVSGEVRGGQVLQYDDPSGARLIILGVEPYGCFAGFSGGSHLVAHVDMLTDIIGLIDIVEDNPLLHISGQEAPIVHSVTASIAQGPMLAEESALQYQDIELAALGTDVTLYPSSAEFAAAGGESLGILRSPSAENLSQGSSVPSALAEIAVEISSASLRENFLSNQKFWVCAVTAPYPLTLLLPEEAAQNIDPGYIASGTVHLTASTIAATGCGGGSCSSCGGGCGGH